MALPDLSPKARAFLDTLLEVLPQREGEILVAWLGTFYRYQLEWLLDPSEHAMLVKARQIGASHTFGAAAVLWGVYLGETTTIVSIGQEEANEVLAKSKLHAKVLRELGSRMARLARDKETRIHFASGGRIISLPNTSAGRSFSGNVLLDEIGYYRWPKVSWDGASAVSMHDGLKLRVFSTPNGVGNFWHQELWSNQSPEMSAYTRHEVTIDDARADGLRVRDEKLWAMAYGDQRLYDQLFRCKFLDGVNQLIPAEAIQACSVESTWRTPDDGVCFAGLDVGRTADRTELVIVRVVTDMVNGTPFPRAYVQHVETRKRTEDAELDRLAALAMSPPYSCVRLAIDSTGLGSFPAERIQKRFGQTRVWPVSFTLQSKEELATTMHHAFTNGWVRIPSADTVLRDELASLRREVTRAGNIRFDAPQTSEGHGDRAWALALALHAIGRDRRAYEVPR